MASEAVVGAVLGRAIAQLYTAVKGAKDKVTDFQPALTRLESTLRSLLPRANEIMRLNQELENSDLELSTILRNGKALVDKCSNVSRINLYRKLKYSKLLIELDLSLLRYLQTSLPLDLLKDTKTLLVMVGELYQKLVDGGKTSNLKKVDAYDSEIESKWDNVLLKMKELALLGAKDERESSKSKEDEYYSEIKSEGESNIPKGDEKKDSSCAKELIRMLKFKAGAKDEEESSKSKEDESSQEPDEEESSKPEGEQNSDKKIIILEGLIKMEDRIELETWKFELKGCTYIFRPQKCSINSDGNFWEEIMLYEKMGTNYVANCQCKKRHGYVMVSRIEKVGILRSEFEQLMETFGNINHPNIVSLFGFCFHQSCLFLFYDTFPKGAAKGASLYTRLHGDIWRVANSDSPPVRSAPCEFSLESKLKIAHGVARGISHLHSVECIHGNLHSYNVIINSDHDGCISDYGLLNFSTAAKQSDVYSFGVMVLEMLSGTVPPDFEDHHRWFEKVVSVQEEKYSRIKTRFSKVHNQARKMLKIAVRCVQKNMDKRPEMDYVVKEIQKIRKSRL